MDGLSNGRKNGHVFENGLSDTHALEDDHGDPDSYGLRYGGFDVFSDQFRIGNANGDGDGNGDGHGQQDGRLDRHRNLREHTCSDGIDDAVGNTKADGHRLGFLVVCCDRFWNAHQDGVQNDVADHHDFFDADPFLVGGNDGFALEDRGPHGGSDAEQNRDGDADDVGKHDRTEHGHGDRGSHGIADGLLDRIDFLHGHCNCDVEQYGNQNRNRYGKCNGDGLWNGHGLQNDDAHWIVFSHGVGVYNDNGDGYGVAGLDAFRNAILFFHAIRHGGSDGIAYRDENVFGYVVGHGYDHDVGNAFRHYDGVGGF